MKIQNGWKQKKIPCFIFNESTSERADEIDCLERADASERIELDRDETDRADCAGECDGDGLGRRRPTLLIVWSMWGDISGLVSFNRAIVL